MSVVILIRNLKTFDRFDQSCVLMKWNMFIFYLCEEFSILMQKKYVIFKCVSVVQGQNFTTADS